MNLNTIHCKNCNKAIESFDEPLIEGKEEENQAIQEELE